VHAFLVSHLALSDDRVLYGCFAYKKGTVIGGTVVDKISGWYFCPLASFDSLDRK
jgi:hypothetical protein